MIKRNILATSVLVTSLTAAAIAYGQTPIGQLNTAQGVTISGTVADIFGNKFVIEDASGKMLVENGPEWFRKIEVTRGEKLTVIGRPDGGSFEAFAIVRADGTRIEVRPARGPAPWAGGKKSAVTDGPDVQDSKEPLPLHERVAREVERERHGPAAYSKHWKGKKGPAHVSPSDELPYREILTTLEKNGYTNIHDVDRKRHHYEFDATNRFGERVEVHVDFSGNVYKEERDD